MLLAKAVCRSLCSLQLTHKCTQKQTFREQPKPGLARIAQEEAAEEKRLRSESQEKSHIVTRQEEKEVSENGS